MANLQKTYTEDLADYGYREQEEAKNLFTTLLKFLKMTHTMRYGELIIKLLMMLKKL